MKRILSLLAASLTANACHSTGPASPLAAATASAPTSEVTALIDVSVLPITDDALLAHQTILIENGLIVRMGPRSEVVVPATALAIPATGKYVMPGMADMHVHFPSGPASAEMARILDLSLAHGITTIRGMQGAPEQLEMRARLRRENALAPELFLAGPPIARSLTEDEAREEARSRKAAGYDFIKVIGGFDLPAYRTLVAAAKETGIPVCGHVPPEIGIDEALAARQSSIEHGMGYGKAARESQSALDALARRTRDAGIANCPTLRYFEVSSEADLPSLLRREGMSYASRQDIEEWTEAKQKSPPRPTDDPMKIPRQIVAALAHAGARILVGSDSPGTFSVPGFAYDEELRELARAGMPPSEILRAATRSAAEYLGTEKETGTIAVGKRADLVVLEADPRESLENLAHPAGVVLRGHWLPREALEQKLRADGG